MSKQHFFMKLIPPRPTFAQDMTAEERAVMQEHVQYVGEAFKQGSVLIYGPVLAPGGAYGMAVLEMADTTEVEKFMAEDPSIKSGLNTFEFYPMRVGQARGSARLPGERAALFARSRSYV
ncbi:MAG: YciI family protein [Candidatus Acidiferrales bacterium]